VAAPDVIHRPDPGLARGLWEASPSTFYLALAIIVVLAAAYLALRLGAFKRFRRPSTTSHP
jgi:hypothetical protein